MGKSIRVTGGGVRSSRGRAAVILAAAIAGFVGSESRGADTTSTWKTATSGNWTTIAKWSSASYPNNGSGGVNYLALINNAGTYTVTLNSDVTLDGLTINAANAKLDQTSSTLVLPTLALTSGTYKLDGGTLSGGMSGGTVTLGAGANFQLLSGTLDNLTFSGAGLTLSNSISVTNGLNMSGQTFAITGDNSVLNFDGASQMIDQLTLDANPLIAGDAPTIYVGGPNSGGAVTLTLGTNATLTGNASVNDYYSFSTLANQGLINADITGQTLTIGTTHLTNSSTGTIEATNGGTLTIQTTDFVNTGIATATGGGILNINSSETIANLGTVKANGGTVNIGGTLDNSGNTLTLNNATGSWTLTGTLLNGNLALADGQMLTISGGTLDNVTLQNDLTQTQSSATINLNDTFNGSGHNLNLNGDYSILSLGGANPSVEDVSINAVPVDAGSAITIYAGGPGSGMVTAILGADVILHGNANIQDYYGGSTLQNEGLINADITGQTLTIGTTHLTNSSTGTIEATNGGTLTIQTADFVNTGIATATGGGILNINSSETIANLGTVKANGGTVNIGGTLDNSGNTLTLNNATGSWTLTGTLLNGNLALADGQMLTISGGTLDNVTLQNDLTQTQSSATINLNDTFNGSGHNLNLNGDYSILSLGGANPSVEDVSINAVPVDAGSAITIYAGGPGSGMVTAILGADVILHGNANIQDYYGGSTLQNEGLINADITGQTLTIGTTHLTNSSTGTIEATNGGTLTIQTADFVNTGIATATGGGILNINSSETIANLGTVKANGGTVNIGGTLDNSGNTLTLNNATGSWTLTGTLLNGNLALADGQMLTISGGTLDNVTLQNDLTQTQSSATINLNDTFNGSGHNLNLNGDYSILSLGGANPSVEDVSINAVPVDAGSAITIYAGGPGSGMVTAILGADVILHGNANIQDYYGGSTLQNEGLINADITGQTLTIQTSNFINSGTAEATNGGILQINSTNWTNNATISGAVIGGNATLNTGSTTSLAPASSSSIASLTMNGTAKLDITTATFSIDYAANNNASPFSTIESEIISGYNHGGWNGPGIISTSADSHHGIGFLDNGTSVLVRYTLLGDTDLSGSINFNDLLTLAQHYGQSNQTWATGDTDYNNSINFNDLLSLAQNYGQSVDPTSDADFSPSFLQDWNLALSESAAVPEPTSIALLSISATALLRRRRQSRA